MLLWPMLCVVERGLLEVRFPDVVFLMPCFCHRHLPILCRRCFRLF